MSQTVAEIVQELRAAGFSQTEIARRTGIPQPRLSRWQAGVVPASVDDALRLQALLQQVLMQGHTPAKAAA